MTALRLGLVGFGKIARDQHLPAIAATAGVELVAVASPNLEPAGSANYPDLEAMLAAEPDLDAVVMCQPPQVRYGAARQALLAGKHVFLEKPPASSVSELEALVSLATRKGLTLFAGWHSRCAPAVAPARAWLRDRTLRRGEIVWKENVRHWHPDQDWIFQAGGFGVFDPGINALSILTEILGDPIVLTQAELEIPTNRHAPIAATLSLETSAGAPIVAGFDFRQTGAQTWDISLETDDGAIRLSEGGAKLTIGAAPQPTPPENEYSALYRRFVDLVRACRSDADVRPLCLVADAFLRGRYRSTEPFEF